MNWFVECHLSRALRESQPWKCWGRCFRQQDRLGVFGKSKETLVPMRRVALQV